MMVHAYINYTPFLKALEDHIAFFVNSNGIFAIKPLNIYANFLFVHFKRNSIKAHPP